MDQALRYNEDKLKMSLVPTELIEGVAKVLTYGANKYTVRDGEGNITTRGDNNWRKGLPWMSVIDSLERHLLAFKKGEDLDKESGLLHLAHAATNIAFLMNYYGSHPEMDDRIHRTLTKLRITLDIDDVCADFLGGWCEKYGIEIPSSWQFDRAIQEKFTSMDKTGELEEFYMGLKPKIDPKELTFEPFAYITARPVPSEITSKWLDKHGFPSAPVWTVGVGGSKLNVIKQLGATIHIDDNHDTYTELNKNGICCYLMDALHNKKFNVGIRRINSLKEFYI